MPDTPLNPDALDNLATVVFGFDIEEWNEHDEDEKRQLLAPYIRTIETYLAAALQEVTEREQLTALPEKIVLEDRRGTIWQKINGTWYTPGSKHDYSDQSVMLPARVLYRQEVKP